LALESGAPIVPVAICGSERVRGWRRLRFPRVKVVYGQPLHYEQVSGCSREQQQEVADEVLAQVRALYGQLSEAASSTPSPDRPPVLHG
jgi:1-acyl-sn-glycerol-3-phosphate acyltransferase